MGIIIKKRAHVNPKGKQPKQSKYQKRSASKYQSISPADIKKQLEAKRIKAKKLIDKQKENQQQKDYTENSVIPQKKKSAGKATTAIMMALLSATGGCGFKFMGQDFHMPFPVLTPEKFQPIEKGKSKTNKEKTAAHNKATQTPKLAQGRSGIAQSSIRQSSTKQKKIEKEANDKPKVNEKIQQTIDHLETQISGFEDEVEKMKTASTDLQIAFKWLRSNSNNYKAEEYTYYSYMLPISHQLADNLRDIESMSPAEVSIRTFEQSAKYAKQAEVLNEYVTYIKNMKEALEDSNHDFHNLEEFEEFNDDVLSKLEKTLDCLEKIHNSYSSFIIPCDYRDYGNNISDKEKIRHNKKISKEIDENIDDIKNTNKALANVKKKKKTKISKKIEAQYLQDVKNAKKKVEKKGTRKHIKGIINGVQKSIDHHKNQVKKIEKDANELETAYKWLRSNMDKKGTDEYIRCTQTLPERHNLADDNESYYAISPIKTNTRIYEQAAKYKKQVKFINAQITALNNAIAALKKGHFDHYFNKEYKNNLSLTINKKEIRERLIDEITSSVELNKHLDIIHLNFSPFYKPCEYRGYGKNGTEQSKIELSKEVSESIDKHIDSLEKENWAKLILDFQLN